jgi:myosin-crossreactive antigen
MALSHCLSTTVLFRFWNSLVGRTMFFYSLYAKYYFALRSLVEKVDFRRRYNRMVGRVDSVAQSEALKIQKRTAQVKEEALLQLSRSM